MDAYTVYDDFLSYIQENDSIITFLEDNHSILNDFVEPVIKTLNYLNKQKISEGSELNHEDFDIFQFGFEYLFENVEQIKLYLEGFNQDFLLLEEKSFYIKMVFQLEELKLELEKKSDIDATTMEHDLSFIDEALSFFEDLVHSKQNLYDEHKMNQYIVKFNELYEEYDDIVLLSDAFDQYCSTYGI